MKNKTIKATETVIKRYNKVISKITEIECQKNFPEKFAALKQEHPNCWIFKNLYEEKKVLVDNQKHRFYRIAYVAHTKQTLTSSDIVMHLCGNNICVNPNHLKVGSTKENISHKKIHGTGTMRNTNLSKEDIKNIRTQYNSTNILQRELGDLYNISQREISYIIQNIIHYDPEYKQTRFFFKNTEDESTNGRKGVLTELEVKRICGYLNMPNLSNVDIAKLCNTTVNVVSKINNGANYKRIAKKYLDPKRNQF